MLMQRSVDTARPDTPFPFSITVCSIDEMLRSCRAGVSHVVSILDPHAPVPWVLDALGCHDRLVLRFHDVIAETVDAVAPGPQHIAALLDFAADLMSPTPPRARLLIHCRAGVSRSPAALALILAARTPALTPAAIAGEVLRLRPCAWPNLRMIEIGDELLGRHGALIEAARQIYRLRLAKQPELAPLMLRHGRRREVEAGRRLVRSAAT
jgi:predicted protein tyrosine phosphatase